MSLATSQTNANISQNTWKWQRWQGLPYLTCSLLQDWQHGFFTQQFAPRTPENLVKVLHPEAEVYRVKQVHGNTVLNPSEIAQIRQEDNFAPADGIVTESAQEAVWVASADCTPALIGDLATGKVAAVHAGWRGTAKRIIPEAIARFLDAGSSLVNLRIALGPAISGTVYQVTEAVAVEVGSSLLPELKIDTPETILEALQTLCQPPILPDAEVGKVRLDVRQVNLLQLQQLGIKPEQVAIAPYCTYQQPDHFFSYRRSNEKKVQWSGIVSH